MTTTSSGERLRDENSVTTETGGSHFPSPATIARDRIPFLLGVEEQIDDEGMTEMRRILRQGVKQGVVDKRWPSQKAFYLENDCITDEQWRKISGNGTSPIPTMKLEDIVKLCRVLRKLGREFSDFIPEGETRARTFLERVTVLFRQWRNLPDKLSANDYDYVAQLADELFASLSGTTVLSQEVPFANWIRDSVADIKSGRILSLAPAERDRLIQSPTHIPELCIAAADLVMGRAFSESWLNDVLKAAVHAKQADRMQLDSAESERVLSLGLVPVHVSRRAKEMLTGILIINRIQKECAQRCEEIRCPERKQQAMREVFERISEELLLGDKLTSDDFVDPFSKRGWLILKKDWLRSHAETVLIWYRETHVTRTSTMHTLPQKPR